MKIIYETGTGVILAFPKEELKVAVQVLNAMYSVSKLSFIREAIEDIEVELRPKLTLVVHNFICEKCFTMVNDKDENYLKVIRNGDTKHQHRECKPLKENRPE